VAWISGTVGHVNDAELRIEEPSGPDVTVRLLGSGATTFYAVAAGSWNAVGPGVVATGEPACVEALLTSGAPLALRVFLGATCGPS
jgi:hypothetical protein